MLLLVEAAEERRRRPGRIAALGCVDVGALPGAFEDEGEGARGLTRSGRVLGPLALNDIVLDSSASSEEVRMSN